MVQVLKVLAVALLWCSEANNSSGTVPKTPTNSSTVTRGAGFSVAGETKTKVSKKNLRSGAPGLPEVELPRDQFIADYIDEAAKQINTQLAYIPARPYLNVITNSSPMAIQVSGLGAWAYDVEHFKTTYPQGWAGGWKLVAEYVNETRSLLVDGHDTVILLSKGNECVISFAGTHGLADWSTNLNINQPASLPQCGLYGVHQGFFEAFLQFMLNDGWSEDFEPYIYENCSDGVHVTGHSQGAAVAAVFAACLNGAGDSVALPDLWRFGRLVHAGRTVATRTKIADVYGMGGPGISATQFWNYQRADGVFPGVRFFNQDWISFDPVPWSTTMLALTHPRSEAHKLGMSIETYEAWTENAKFEPRTVSFVPDIFAHLPPEYIRRLLAATRTMQIQVAYADGLPEQSARPLMRSAPNAYATVEATNRKWRSTLRTSTSQNTKAPAWKELMKLGEYEPGDDLEVKVWDSVRPFGEDKSIGTVKIPGTSFEPHGFDGWVSMDSGIRVRVTILIKHHELGKI
mmetsp:Transcript_34802/g.64757  ORF Transcript_34802/g.64757 Transcript_34802/m.64757 type:complete len:516 (+) Transcript_34802:48-1595(+)